MKALVLAGGLPQIDLIRKLKERSIYTILADYYQHPVARDYADIHYRISTLDVDAVRELAVREKVDFLITSCTDQALLTVARLSEELNLPCYIDYQTAKNVTNKAFMKKVMAENAVPTADFRIISSPEEASADRLRFPLIVKPVDCNSSKGVVKVTNEKELRAAAANALSLSRTGTAVAEEFIRGKELSVDVYVEDGKAIVLDITTSEKLKSEDKFIIFRTWHPADLSDAVRARVAVVAQQIADAFRLKNTPLLVQMLVRDESVFVIEFSARAGGGLKYYSIGKRAGVDINGAVIDLTLGIRPEIKRSAPEKKYMVDEYIYCHPGVFDHLEGFEELKRDGILTEYFLFRAKDSGFDTVANSGDRLGAFSIEGDSPEELLWKHKECNRRIRAVSDHGADLIRHDLLQDFDFSKR